MIVVRCICDTVLMSGQRDHPFNDNGETPFHVSVRGIHLEERWDAPEDGAWRSGARSRSVN